MINQDQRLENVIHEISLIPEHGEIIIWCGDNAHDQLGLRFVMYLLSMQVQTVRVVNITDAYELIADRYDPKLDPVTVGQLPMDALKEILKLNERVVPLGDEVRGQLVQEWLHMSECRDMLCIWEDDQLQWVQEDHYDEKIMSIITLLQTEMEVEQDGFVPAGSVIAEFLDTGHWIGDLIVENRLWHLISSGLLEFKGIPYAMYLYSVRVRAGNLILST